MSTRRERVILELDDNFSTGMATAAARTALLRKELDALDGSGRRSATSTDRLGHSAQQSGAQIDRLSGRVKLLAQASAILGPALIPVAAVGIPAMAGLAAQFGFAAVGAGTAIAAFQGVGGALEAMNKAHLEPTTENLQAAQAAMEDITPAAQDFVRQLREMAPAMEKLRDTAAEGLFPGLSEGLDSMQSVLPKVERIVAAVSGELGQIGADTGKSLSSARWSEFFDFLATDAPSALADMATAAGNTGHAMAEMWMAFDPLNDDFSSWMVDATADLDAWATGLSQTAGFQEFVAYLRETGPQVADTLGAIGNALVQIVQAAAPIAGPILKGIEAFANAISAIADSDLGTPIFGMVAALSALNLAMRTSSALSKTTFGGPVVAGMKTQGAALKTLRADWAAYNAVQLSAPWKHTAAEMDASRAAGERLHKTVRETAKEAGKAGAVVAGLAVLTSGLGDSMGITNTASLALMGTMGGPWGAAIGAGVGAALDLVHAGDALSDSLAQLSAMAGKVDLSTFNAQLADIQSQMEDLKDSAGLGDVISDWAKTIGGVLQGDVTFGVTGPTMSDKAQRERALAEQAQSGEVLGPSAASSREGAARVAALAAGYRLTAAAAREAAGGVAVFAANVTAANKAIGAQSNLDAYEASLDNFDTGLKENGKTLNRHTAAGRANRAGLRDIASSALAAAEGMTNFGRRTKFLDNARKGFVDAARAAGLTRKEARTLADQLGLLDRTKATPKVEEKGADASKKRIKGMRDEIQRLKNKRVKMDEKGAAEATRRIQALRAQIAVLQGKTIRITTIMSKVNTGGGSGGNQGVGLEARGGIWSNNAKVYARGGMDVANRHQAELAGPGPARVWREPETQGEAYIPLANDDRRPRARAIAEETVGLLGGDVEWYARGGSRGRGGGQSPHMKELIKALANLKTSVDKQTAARDAIIAKRSELAGTVRDKFKTDIFGESDVWAKGGGDVNGILKADIAKANTFKSLLYALKKKGLDGDALAELAATGDVGKAQSFAALSKKDLGTYETLYNQRAAAASGVGVYAGSAAYSGQQAAANAHLVELNRKMAHLNAEIRGMRHDNHGHAKQTGDEVGKRINGAAASGRRRGARRS